MKTLKMLMLAGACLSAGSQAQSLGDFLKSSATEAARKVVSGKLEQALTGAVGQAAGAAAPQAAEADQPAAATPDPGAPAAARAPALPGGCKRMKGANLMVGPRPESFQPASLWPENTACPVGSFMDLKFEQARAAKTAFREASKIRCNDCEGGYAFDAWGGRSLVRSGDYSKEFPKLLAALKEGESVGWKGNKYHVSITATGAHPIGDTPCRQLHYVLKDAGRTVSEYDGMVCQYKGYYAANPSWNEVL
ncbi:hypothetical protein [Massilia niastensis]|uniref:hypothetical protein n=1 Tax=Massilia niastensis TaxID=544911 RepID=UPI00037FD755|nr:hypothetical protein [Massilia niastensis]